MISLLTVLSTNIPPVGITYGKEFTIPLMGNQYIETEYINKNTAEIRLKGFINNNGTSTILYKNNEEIIELSDNLINTMNKLKCKLLNPYYDIENDRIILILCFKSLLSKKIILNRIHIKE